MGGVDYIALLTLIVGGSLPLTVAVYLSRRYRSSDDWIIGGRRIPWYVAAGTQYATAVGGGVLVAHVGIGCVGVVGLNVHRLRMPRSSSASDTSSRT
jgi:SSS family solute:Na+ symporter